MATDTTGPSRGGWVKSIGLTSIVETLQRLPEFFRSDQIPKWAKFAVVASFAYLISPIDLIPEGAFLAVGLLDDLAIAMWLINFINDTLSNKQQSDVAPSAAPPAGDEPITVEAKPVD